MLCNKNLHELRGPNDRGAHGECVYCVRDRGRQHAAVRSAAVKLYRDLDGAGIPLDVERIVEGHRLQLALEMSRAPRLAG